MSVEKVFSFSGWDREHPLDRPPGDRLDAEFAAQARAIDRLEARVAHLLRADGKLNHGLLAVDSFPHGLIPAIADAALVDAVKLRREAMQLFEQARRTQADIERQLADARDFYLSASRQATLATGMVGGVTAIQLQLTGDLATAVAGTQAARDAIDNTANDAALAAATAQDWADVSVAWAEHMPDTIPPNILATNAITGDHWSSRWWANQAASAVGGMLYHYYVGPYSSPPLTTSASQPLQVGSIYFNTSNNIMYTWNGTSWVPFNTPQPAGTVSLFWQASDGQTVFPLTTADLFGRSVTLNPAKNEGVAVYLNGARLTPSATFAGDYSVNLSTSTLTIAAPVTLNSIVAVDVLKDPADLVSVGIVHVEKLKHFAFDGATTIFALLDAGTSAPVAAVTDASQLLIVIDGVGQEPGVDFTLVSAGASVQLAAAPPTDAKNYAVYLKAS